MQFPDPGESSKILKQEDNLSGTRRNRSGTKHHKTVEKRDFVGRKKSPLSFKLKNFFRCFVLQGSAINRLTKVFCLVNRKIKENVIKSHQTS